jgi:hypothetical protein
MVPYSLSYDPRDGLITFTVLRAISDPEATRLASDLSAAVAQARAAGPVRMLCDFREAPALSPRSRGRLLETMAALRQPDDRIAIVVTTCVRKVKANPMMDEQTRSFVSPAAAMTWLNAWVEMPTTPRPTALAG